MWADINSNGTFARESGEVELSGRISKGEYFVEFNRDVIQCSYQGTTGEAVDDEPGVAGIGISPKLGDPDAVRVWTGNNKNEFQDSAFHLAVFC
jgi:hypothetical protein